MALIDDFNAAFAIARQHGDDEVEDLVVRLAPVLLADDLAVRAAAAAIEAGHGDDLREALTEYATERARIDHDVAEDDKYAAENAGDDLEETHARGSGWWASGLELPDELRAQAQALAEKQGQNLDELFREAVELVVARGSSR